MLRQQLMIQLRPAHPTNCSAVRPLVMKWWGAAKVVIALWLLSVIGSLISFVTLAYIGIIVSIIVPALYDKFRDPVDRCVGTIHQQFSKHYKIVDESLHSRLPLPGALAKDKNP